MKQVLLMVALAAVAIPAKGEAPQFSLAGYNSGFNRIQRTGMIVLGSWAVLNFAGNGIPYLFFSNEALGGEVRSFMLMNIGWNVINASLDFGYMAFGLFLIELSKSRADPAMLTGFGYSLIVQGAALFAFDVAMQIVHAVHRRELDSHLSHL